LFTIVHQQRLSPANFYDATSSTAENCDEISGSGTCSNNFYTFGSFSVSKAKVVKNLQLIQLLLFLIFSSGAMCKLSLPA
jgi:hypothetical protein